VKKRPLKEDEKALWKKVVSEVKPLRPRQETSTAAVSAATGTPPAEPEPAAPVEVVRPAPAPSPAARKPDRPRPHPVAGDLDRKTRRKLARGMMAIDARIDLHGMTQDEAHRALARFIGASVARQRRVVLVITGKGSGGEGRGVLRRAVPHWLAGRDLTRQVVSFGPAHPSHGGDGALYIRLRTGHVHR
jgi:DNA-nicking Smr family endonuclease